MPKYLIKPLFVLLSFGLFSGCDFINPDEEQPAYLHIKRPEFKAGSVFGSNNNEIVSGWVYYNGRLLGVFDLPVDLPVLNSGTTKITVEAGIIADGQRATRTNYQLYTRYDSTLTLTPGQSYTINPEFRYQSFVIQPFYRDFENTNQDPLVVNEPYTLVRKPNVPSDSLYFEDCNTPANLNCNTHFGYVQSLPDTATQIKLVSNLSNLQIPQAGKPVFAEFNIRSSRQVQVGLIAVINGVAQTRTELSILPSDTWKKVYVNLEGEVNSGTNASTTFNLVFLMNPTKSGKDYLAIDNIRLIHFP